jgi:hypothetical protein
VSAGLRLDPSVVSKRLVWTPYTRTWSGRGEGLVWAVSRIDDTALWGPAYDAESRVRVLVAGKVAFDAGESDAAERLPYQGGLAARLILSRWINKRSRIAASRTPEFSYCRGLVSLYLPPDSPDLNPIEHNSSPNCKVVLRKVAARAIEGLLVGHRLLPRGILAARMCGSLGQCRI